MEDRAARVARRREPRLAVTVAAEGLGGVAGAAIGLAAVRLRRMRGDEVGRMVAARHALGGVTVGAESLGVTARALRGAGGRLRAMGAREARWMHPYDARRGVSMDALPGSREGIPRQRHGPVLRGGAYGERPAELHPRRGRFVCIGETPDHVARALTRVACLAAGPRVAGRAARHVRPGSLAVQEHEASVAVIGGRRIDGRLRTDEARDALVRRQRTDGRLARAVHVTALAALTRMAHGTGDAIRAC